MQKQAQLSLTAVQILLRYTFFNYYYYYLFGLFIYLFIFNSQSLCDCISETLWNHDFSILYLQAHSAYFGLNTKTFRTNIPLDCISHG